MNKLTLARFCVGRVGRANIEESNGRVLVGCRRPPASYPRGNFSDTCCAAAAARGSLGHAFACRARGGRQASPLLPLRSRRGFWARGEDLWAPTLGCRRRAAPAKHLDCACLGDQGLQSAWGSHSAGLPTGCGSLWALGAQADAELDGVFFPRHPAQARSLDCALARPRIGTVAVSLPRSCMSPIK